MKMSATTKDYFWNSVGSFLQSAISPALLVLITRINGIYDSGIFSFAMSVSVVFWVFSMWGGRTYQVSDVSRQFSSGGYIAVRFIASLIVVAAAIVFCVASGYDLVKTLVIMLLVGFKILESVADSLYGILQVHNRLYIAGKSLVIKAVAGFLAFLIIDMITKNLALGSIALLLVNLIVIIAYDIVWVGRVEKIKAKFSLAAVSKYTGEAKTIMKITSPVFAVMFMTMFSLNIPRYFLDRYHPEEIGYFGIMAMPITLLALFIMFIIQPNIVTMAKEFSQRNIAAFTKIVRKIITATYAIGVVAVIATALVGVIILNTVFGIDIEKFHAELVVMIIGAVANSVVTVYVNTLIVARLFKWQFYLLLITNLVAAVVSLFIIDDYATMGAVCVFSCISIVQAILLSIYYKKTIKVL